MICSSAHEPLIIANHLVIVVFLKKLVSADEEVAKKQKIDAVGVASGLVSSLNEDIISFLGLEPKDASVLCGKLTELVSKYGVSALDAWTSATAKHKDAFLHEMCAKHRRIPLVVLTHAVDILKLNVNVQRSGDGLTLLHLAYWQKNEVLAIELDRLGADASLKNNYGENCSELMLLVRDKLRRVIWIDLELTTLDLSKTEILECAVIITKPDCVTEVIRKEWVIHYDDDVLDSLSQWHMDTFKSREAGGNGLFDDIRQSKLSKEEFAQELLLLLKENCAKGCVLAGSSVHCDKEVLRARHPEVHDYLSHQIIDISTINSLVLRLAPDRAIENVVGPSNLAANHRALGDIERSMALLASFRAQKVLTL